MRSGGRMVRWAGNYLGVQFLVHVSPGPNVSEIGGFLDAHFLCGIQGAPVWQIHVLSVLEGDVEAFQARAHAESEFSIWTEPSGTITATDWAAHVRYYLVAENTAGWLLAQDVYCGIRRLAIAAHGACVMLHGACVMVRGRVVAFFGDKGAGKTVAAHSLILRQKAAYIAGDKICAWIARNGDVACSGLISAVRIRLVDRSLFSDAPSHAAVFARAAELAADPHRMIGDKVCMAPAEFCRLASAELLPLATPAVLVFLQRAGENGSASLLTGAEVRNQLERHRVQDFSPVASAHAETARVSAVLGAAPARQVLDALTQQCIGYVTSERPNLARLIKRIDSVPAGR